VEDGAMRLAHHLRQHVEPTAVGHADDDLFHPERAAAFDDLFERGDRRFGAIETEALGAGEFQIAEFLETFRFDQLVEDRALALRREGDFLVRPLDPCLDPTLLCGVGDVHELDAERLAVRAAKDRENFPQRAEFETEHAVEKDLTVVVRFCEAIRARVEIFLVVVRLEPERIEVCVEVPARAVGADQHQGADRIPRGLLHLGNGELDACRLRPRLDLVAERALQRLPVAVERGDEFAARGLRPVCPLPRRPARARRDGGGVVFEALEERLPFGVERRRIGLITGVEVLDVIGITAVEERGAREGGIGVLTRHAQVLWVSILAGREIAARERSAASLH
jgi:hypothetical protein